MVGRGSGMRWARVWSAARTVRWRSDTGLVIMVSTASLSALRRSRCSARALSSFMLLTCGGKE